MRDAPRPAEEGYLQPPIKYEARKATAKNVGRNRPASAAQVEAILTLSGTDPRRLANFTVKRADQMIKTLQQGKKVKARSLDSGVVIFKRVSKAE